MSDIIVNGIITNAMPVGDYDRRIVILTKEIGRISAFARFARNPKNHLRGSTREFICGKFKLHYSKSSYVVTDIEVINYFEAITQDSEKSIYASYFLEVINYFTRENINESESLHLLYRSFEELIKSRFSNRLIRAIFEFKMLVIHGEYPLLKRYVDTKNKLEDKDRYAFSINQNGIVENDKENISKDTVYTMMYIVENIASRVYTFKLSTTIEDEFCKLVEEYFKTKIDKEFVSLNALIWQDELEKFKIMLKK